MSATIRSLGAFLAIASAIAGCGDDSNGSDPAHGSGGAANGAGGGVPTGGVVGSGGSNGGTATTGGQGGVAGGGPSGGAPSGGGSGGAISFGGTGAAGAPTPEPCETAAGEDGDEDGFSVTAGDCNDCDPNSNPGAYDVPENGVDEDCNGTKDDEPRACDGDLADDADAFGAARALGLCRIQRGGSWGLVDARYVFPDGTAESLPSLLGCDASAPPNPMSHGVLREFGDVLAPREGSRLVALSSGMARAGVLEVPPPGSGVSPEAGRMCTASNPPPGFPENSAACPGVTAQSGLTYDGVALELRIKVPTNAEGVVFDFDFLTTEFPNFVCSADGYNDQFVALLWSAHPNLPANHNVSFDRRGNDVNVNNGFVEVCAPTTVGGRQLECKLGLGELAGTGYTGPEQTGSNGPFIPGGSTSWLSTAAGVVPGETITVRFGVWDAGDNQFDSTTLLDNVRWEVAAGEPAPGKPPVTDRPPKLH